MSVSVVVTNEKRVVVTDRSHILTLITPTTGPQVLEVTGPSGPMDIRGDYTTTATFRIMITEEIAAALMTDLRGRWVHPAAQPGDGDGR